MRYTFLLIVLVYQTSVGQNILKIEADTNHFHIDETNKLILFQTNLTPFRSIPDTLSVQLTVDDDIYQLVGNHSGLSSASSYQVHKGNTYYRLFFTQLPVISIKSNSTVVDASKVSAEFKYVDERQILTSSIGIELRGGSSLSFPKKTYDLELRDGGGKQSRDAQFGDLREDDDWILDGLYNEPLRMRSFMSHKLWLAMHRPTYQNEEPEAKAGADVMWVEVFLQGTYWGVYMLSEQVDRKLLKLKTFKDGEVRGELFKGSQWGDAVLFRGTPPPYSSSSRQWDGYEAKYPEQADTTDWANLHQLIDFVLNEDSLVFNETVANRFNMSNAVDYFILLNLLWADDNRGKNIYVARYTNKMPYFYVPWDLDATWGLRYDGAQHNTANRILSNGLYQRLIKQNQDFNTRLTQRWYELRSGVLSDKAVADLIDNTHATLISNNVYEREQIAWKEYEYDSASFDYLKSWTERRFAYLDRYFYDPVLSIDDLEIEEERDVLYPNPANGSFKVTLPHQRPVPYQLINVHGLVAKSGTIRSDNPIINVAGLPAGHYIFRAEDTIERVLIAH